MRVMYDVYAIMGALGLLLLVEAIISTNKNITFDDRPKPIVQEVYEVKPNSVHNDELDLLKRRLQILEEKNKDLYKQIKENKTVEDEY